MLYKLQSAWILLFTNYFCKRNVAQNQLLMLKSFCTKKVCYFLKGSAVSHTSNAKKTEIQVIWKAPSNAPPTVQFLWVRFGLYLSILKIFLNYLLDPLKFKPIFVFISHYFSHIKCHSSCPLQDFLAQASWSCHISGGRNSRSTQINHRPVYKLCKHLYTASASTCQSTNCKCICFSKQH